jgi:hypothetical protein
MKRTSENCMITARWRGKKLPEMWVWGWVTESGVFPLGGKDRARTTNSNFKGEHS